MMEYDYIINKPELNEDTLAHYGVKGMKWRKHLKGKYYSAKSKATAGLVKTRRKIRGIAPEDITNSGLFRKMDPKIVTTTEKRDLLDNKIMYNRTTSNYDNRRDYGKANSRSGGAGANVEAGIAAGRERAKKRKKK